MSDSASKSSLSPTTFEFTKRKRWADLLIHELSDAIIFVLSPEAKIWFCSRAVSELLGWSDAELIDHQFIDLVNPEDQRAFHVAFDDSLRTRIEMNTYVRLKTKSPIHTPDIPQSEVLFEVKGCPFFIENEPASRCFFAVAKPYPSRNVAMLNTFLELKAEHERLQKRLAELRARAPSPPTSGPSTSNVYSLRSPSALRPPTQANTSFRSSDAPGGLYPQHLEHSYDNLVPLGGPLQGFVHESLGLNVVSGQYTVPSSTQPTDDDLGDDGSRRKKRKSNTTEQYVCITCGRTDSPEWRKGPQGPKTLCNACGLRWAKEVRSKVDENAAVASTSNTANNV